MPDEPGVRYVLVDGGDKLLVLCPGSLTVQVSYRISTINGGATWTTPVARVLGKFRDEALLAVAQDPSRLLSEVPACTLLHPPDLQAGRPL